MLLASDFQTLFAGRDRFDSESLILKHAAKRIADAPFIINYEDRMLHFSFNAPMGAR